METHTTLTFCQQCHMKCPVEVTTINGRMVDVAGTSCVKGKYVAENVYDPNRLLYPLRREGKKGGGAWRRISWDEALDAIANRFNEIRALYGNEAIASIRGCGHKDNSGIAAELFAILVDTPNSLNINHLCGMPSHIAQKATFGTTLTYDYGPDFANSKCILLWGTNIAHTRPIIARQIFSTKAAGAKLIVVDPRPTVEAQRADVWLRVRPGADCALALGMIKVVIEEDLYDHDFVEEWCVGFNELKDHVGKYSLDEIAETTWLPKNRIIEAARLFASTNPASCHLRQGAQAIKINAAQTSRAIGILIALVNTIDIKGGNLFPREPWGANFLSPVSSWGKTDGVGAKDYPLMKTDRPFGHLPASAESMLNGKIKALFAPGCNMIISNVNSRKVWDALKRLEFLVVVDLVMTPTADLADIVLPAAHWLETEILLSYWNNPVRPRVMATKKAIKPCGECRDDRQIVLDMVRKMGIRPPWSTVMELNDDDWRIKPLSIKFKEIQEIPRQVLYFERKYLSYKENGFNTPSGKVELYSTLFEKYGYDPLPRHVEPPESPISTPEVVKEYPYILIDHRNIAYEHSEYRSSPSLRKLMPHPQIEINPDTAGQLGIAEGDEMWIETSPSKNRYGQRVKGKAKLVAQLHPEVISMQFGWWFPEKEGPEHGCFDSNINAVLSDDPPYEPLSGCPHARAIQCKAGKVEDTG